MSVLKFSTCVRRPRIRIFFASDETVSFQDVPELLLPSTSTDLKHIYELITGTPWDAFPPQVASVDDRAGFCAACSVTTSLPLPISPPNWHKIPQRPYDHGRKQWDFTPLESVSFSINGRLGVNMGDARRKRFEGLHGRDDIVLQDGRPGGTVSCLFSVRSS